MITLSNKRCEPPPTPYRLHRFATGDLRGRGRCVALVVDCGAYTVVDEIEIYQGQEAWLNQAPQGRKFKISPRDYYHAQQVANSVRARMHTDLNNILGGLDSTQLSAAEKADLRARAAKLWLNLKYGGKGSCYWAFGDEAGHSWNAYVQPRSCYSPLFLSKTTVTDAKQMEAIREGAEDYEYFTMLRARVTELERKGVSGGQYLARVEDRRRARAARILPLCLQG